jgi:hypothetical protein
MVRSKIKSTFVYLSGLITFALFYSLIAGIEMSSSLSTAHTKMKNITDVHNAAIDDKEEEEVKFILQPPTSSPTTTAIVIQPTKVVHSAVSSNTNSSNKSKHNSRSNNDNPWFDDDYTDSQREERPLAPLVANASAIFVERWCDLHGVDWIPKSNSRRWQQRAPHFLIPGAKYSGTSELAQELANHPSIVPPRTLESGFFFQHNFYRYISAKQDKTKVLAARSRMYARDYQLTSAFKTGKSKLLSFDASPGYLFYSSTLPRRILCVMPWIRLVVVLRNPVDRVWEHYQVARSRGLTLSLEDWIEKEFALMDQVGLLNATSKEENYAWHDYQRTTLEGAIGRSLYDIQLRQWFQALRAVGRDPSKSVYVVRAEDLAREPQKEYSAILNFLGLPDAPLQTPTAWNRFRGGQSGREGIKRATYKQLESFFGPHSKRLRSVLRRYRVRTGGKRLFS